MHHTLQLASALDVAGVSTVLNTLRSLPGVHGVEAISGANIVAVNYDERTSVQELGAALARAGYPEKQRRHGGGCCGSCGG